MHKFVFSSLAAFLSILLFASIAAAQNPSLSVSEKDIAVFAGDSASVDLSIKNNDDIAQTFSVSVFPNFWNRVSVGPEFNLIRVDPGDTKSMKILFAVPIEAKAITNEFVISVISSDDATIAANETVRLAVRFRSPVQVTGQTTDKIAYNPSEIVKVTVEVSNLATENSEEYALQTVVSLEGRTIKVFDNFVEAMSPKSTRVFINEFQLQKYTEPGDYKIESVLRNNLGFVVSKTAEPLVFKVNRVETVEKTSKTDFGFLSARTTVTAMYNGNAPSQITLKVDVPSFAKELFVSDTPVTETTEAGGVTTFKYVSPVLNPGDEYKISYQIVVWQIWVTGIVIAAIVWVAFRFVFTPTIVKKYRKTIISKDQEILVTLDVRNRSLSTIRDIVIKDFVPPVVKVVEKFETVRPSIKHTRDGTELTWRLDSLHAQEERLLTYRVSPVMEITGTLRLPNATMKYKGAKRSIHETFSREIIARSR